MPTRSERQLHRMSRCLLEPISGVLSKMCVQKLSSRARRPIVGKVLPLNIGYCYFLSTIEPKVNVWPAVSPTSCAWDIPHCVITII